ncbi:MAG: NDP-sugar synthase [Cyanobacteriota bacterium]|nr:NDP-sugar synthase [Cyanobacteriota bacterium]
MQAVILAGGKGTRLRPLTRQQPKPLVPLLEIPFLHWMVERCCQVGVDSIVISLGYRGDQIKDFLGDGSAWGIPIQLIQESTPLDTAGALVLARPYFTKDPLLVFNADILTDLDLRAVMDYHRATGSQATLTLTRVADITAYGLVELNVQGKIQSFREKPSPAEAQLITTNTINAGTYVLDPAIFDAYQPGDPLSFERQVFPQLLGRGGQMQGYIHEGYWRDLGNPASYYQGQLDILLGNMTDFPLVDVEQPQPGIWIHRTAQVAAEASLSSPCYVGSHTVVGARAVVPAGTIIAGDSWVDGRIAPGAYGQGTLLV